MKKIQTITLLGRKWRDNVYGNTYHKTVIMVNGETVGKTEFQYGYGEAYVQSGAQWLMDNEYIPKDAGLLLWQYCRDNNIHFEHSSAWYLKREL
jgi:hypothetical protein